MKKQATLLMAVSLLLVGCGGSVDTTKERIAKIDVITADAEGTVIKGEPLNVLFKANSEVPYIDLKEGAKIFGDVRKSLCRGLSGSCEASVSDNKLIYTVENGSKATFDLANQTLTFEDMDVFFNFTPAYKPVTVFAPTSTMKAIKVTKQEYQGGKAVTFDLKPYSHLDIYRHGDSLYVPYTVFSDVFLSANESFNLAYNFKDFYYLTPLTPLFANLFGENVPTELGTKYYEESKKSATVSADYAAFAYDATCFDFDNLYGLKNHKGITNFDTFFSSKGYKQDLLSGDSHKMDNAFAYGLSYLMDGHTAKNATSPLYTYGEGTEVSEKMNPAMVSWLNGGDSFAKEKVKAGIKDGLVIEPTFGGAYISFNEFSALDEDLFYSTLPTDPTSSTPTLFKSAYQTITSSENKDKVKFVCVDLATNDGGAIDSVVYILSMLLGEVFLDNINPLSGAHNRTYFKVDINGDGAIDEKDKSLKELGYKIVFLNSSYTFSSGNALPMFAKENDANIITVGEKTSGGTCSVRHSMSSIGAPFQQSSHLSLARRVGESWGNLENGIEAEVPLQQENMFDRLFIGAMIADKIAK